jgi:hypothetical protein
MGRVVLLLSLLLASCGPYVGPDYPDGYDTCLRTAYEMPICAMGGAYEWVPGYYGIHGYYHSGHYRHGRAWQYPRDHRSYGRSSWHGTSHRRR